MQYNLYLLLEEKLEVDIDELLKTVGGYKKVTPVYAEDADAKYAHECVEIINRDVYGVTASKEEKTKPVVEHKRNNPEAGSKGNW